MSGSRHDADVLVAGAGPAGLTAAVLLAEQGLDVLVVDPRPDRTWPTYAAWDDALSPDVARADVWSAVDVVTDAGRTTWGRPYARLDGPVWRTSLHDRLTASGGRLRRTAALSVAHDATAGDVALDDGSTVRCRLVVDASGGGTLLRGGAASRSPARAAQTAYGLRAGLDVAVGGAPLERSRAVFMDFTAGHLPAARRDPASFLYVLPQADGPVLLEETSLAARPPLAVAVLADRLRRRLQADRWSLVGPVAVERVHVDLERLPPPPQRVVALGAAGGAVHPATGYGVAAGLRAAAVLAEVVGAQVRAGAGPGRVAAAAWEATWPDRARRARAVQAFGVEALLRLDAAATGRFFAAFASLPDASVRDYLGDDAGTARLAAVMLAVFGRAPASVRTELVRAAVSADGATALRRLLRSSSAVRTLRP